MRYEIRWANGTWIIFDLREYKACEAFDAYKAALRKFNAPEIPAARRHIREQRGAR